MRDAIEALPGTPSDARRSPRPESMAETAAAPTADAAATPPTTEEAVPRYVVLLAMCAALNSCNLGYDIGVNSGVGPHLQAKGEGMNLSNLQLELFFRYPEIFTINLAKKKAFIQNEQAKRRRSVKKMLA